MTLDGARTCSESQCIFSESLLISEFHPNTFIHVNWFLFLCHLYELVVNKNWVWGDRNLRFNINLIFTFELKFWTIWKYCVLRTGIKTSIQRLILRSPLCLFSHYFPEMLTNSFIFVEWLKFKIIFFALKLSSQFPQFYGAFSLENLQCSMWL